jgi:hypothetical protein
MINFQDMEYELFLGQQLIPYQDTSSATNGIRTFGHAFHIVLAQIILSVEYHSYISGGKVQISLGPGLLNWGVFQTGT